MARVRFAEATLLSTLFLICSLGSPTTGYGQADDDGQAQARISSEYLSRLMAQSPDILRGTLQLVTEVADEHCQMIAHVEDIGRLQQIQDLSDSHLEGVLKVLASRRGAWQTYPGNQEWTQLKDAEYRAAAHFFWNAKITECVEQRRGSLRSTVAEVREGTLQATWSGRCWTNSPDIHPTPTGRISLSFRPDGTIDGYLHPPGSAVGLRLLGAVYPGGGIEVQRHPDERRIYDVKLTGSVAPGGSGQWTGSGIIHIAGKYMDEGWQCSGNWNSG